MFQNGYSIFKDLLHQVIRIEISQRNITVRKRFLFNLPLLFVFHKWFNVPKNHVMKTDNVNLPIIFFNIYIFCVNLLKNQQNYVMKRRRRRLIWSIFSVVGGESKQTN